VVAVAAPRPIPEATVKDVRGGDHSMALPDDPTSTASGGPEASPASRFNPGVGWWGVLAVAVWFFWADAPTLNSRDRYGPVTAWGAKVGYGLIAARAVVGLLARDRSWVWTVYATLLLLVGSLVVLLVQRVGRD
jgi:hypothetical protein